MPALKSCVALHTTAFDEFESYGRSAVFIERQDRAMLAKAIVEPFGDPVRVAALGDAARADAERFRADRTASLLLDVLHRAAGRTR